MSVKDSIKKTIKELRKRREFRTQKEVAEHLGYNSSYFSRALNSNDIPPDLEDKFFRAFPKSNYLSINNNQASAQLDKVLKKNNKDKVKFIESYGYMVVEYADLRTSAGKIGSTPVEELPDKRKMLVPKEYEKGNFLVVRVEGNSMNDGTNRSLLDGDEILIKEFTLDSTYTIPFRTNLFVISSNEGGVVKQITAYNNITGEITCHSFNPKWDDYTIDLKNVYKLFTVEKIVKRKPIF